MLYLSYVKNNLYVCGTGHRVKVKNAPSGGRETINNTCCIDEPLLQRSLMVTDVSMIIP